MVKVNGPMFSFSASGTLADTAVFSTWKGRPYVRQRVIPTNPKSASQVGIRQMLAYLSQEWQNLTAANQATWEDIANDAQISPFNAYVGQNLYDWRNGLFPTKNYPATRDDTAPVLGTLTLSQVGRNIQVTQAVTTVNDGWLIAIYESTSTGFTPGFANSKKTIQITGTGNHTIEIGPYDPGTYYVRTIGGTTAGNKSSATTEVSITIT